jgi:DNA-binding PadR family transcriptional regulator
MDLRGHLDLLLLATLRRLGRAHGYGVIAALREASGGTLRLAEGTVYPALERLERGGAVHSTAETAGGRPRRVYRLTAAGHLLLADRRRRWEAFSEGVRRVVEGSEPAAAGPTLGGCAPSPPPPSRSPRSPDR